MPSTPRQKIDLPLYAGGYAGDAAWLNSFRCVNLYPERIEGEISKVALIGTPGLKLKTSFGSGPHRGAIEHLGDSYIVAESNVYKYDKFGAKTLIGTLTTTTDPVSMSSNGSAGGQLTVVDGEKMWVWDGATFTDVTSSLLYTNPIKAIFMEGYTIVLFKDKPSYQISDLYDSTTWSGLDFATAELDKGNLLALINDHRQLWLIGENVSEVWYHSGNDFPFDVAQNGLVKWGILAPNSLANTENYGLLWLSKNANGQGEVIQTQGFNAVSVTPHTILSIWRTYERLDDAVAFIYQQHGHVFYQITFPTARKTWCYNITEKAWFEKTSENSRHRANTALYFNNEHLVGDYENGYLYVLDMDTFTDNNKTILRFFTTYHISSTREQVRHHFLELEGESGVELLEGQGSAPVITLEFSDDGGHTFGNARTRPYSVDSKNYTPVARWSMLGTTRNRVYRVSMSDPIKWRLGRVILDYSDLLH